MSGKPDSVECPVCGVAFDPSIQGGFCTNPECGEYRWEPDDEDGQADAEEDAQSDTQEDAQAAVSTPDEQAEDDEIECPSCGSTVPHKNHCLSCGDELPDEAPASGESPEPETPTCHDCGEEVEPDWKACPHCGAALDESAGDGADDEATDAGGAETETAESPERVVIEVDGRGIEAEDGDVVGRKIRSAYVESGGDEEEARYVHREHVEIERDGGEFYVVNRGRNGTKVNGEELALDDRTAVSDGDRINFAEVVTGTVKLE